METPAPAFLFGLVADPQYSDKEDAHHDGRNQRYREATGKLQAAVDAFLSEPQLAFVLTLGDSIDGRETPEQSKEDLDKVAVIMEKMAPIPVYSLLGNHDTSVPRQHYITRLGMPSNYYAVTPAPGWRLLVLDTTDLSTWSHHPEDSAEAAEATEYAESHPKESFPNVLPWNGGLAATQMSWFQQQLAEAEAVGARVIVASHHPIGEGSGSRALLAWNWEELQQRLTASPAVVLCVAGHDHPGGYAQHGHVHFVTLEGMLEAPEGSNAYSVVSVHDSHINIRGVGTVTSRTLLLPERQPS